MSNQQVDLSKAKPFVFELSFDAESMAERRRQKQAERDRAAAEEAEAAAVVEPPSFSEDELADARAKAYEEGRAAGLADAEQAREAGLTAMLETIAAQIAGLHVHQDVANEKLAADLTEFGRTVMSKLLPHYVEKHGPDEVTAVLSDGFARLVQEDRIIITVAQEMHDMLEPRIEAMAAKSGYDGRLKLVSDPDMGPADVVVSWGDGRLERLTDETWREIDAALESAIAGMREYAEKLEETIEPSARRKPDVSANPAPQPETRPDSVPETAAAADVEPPSVEQPQETEATEAAEATSNEDDIAAAENAGETEKADETEETDTPVTNEQG